MCHILCHTSQAFPFLGLLSFWCLRVCGGAAKNNVVSDLDSLQMKLTDGNRKSAVQERTLIPTGMPAVWLHLSGIATKFLPCAPHPWHLFSDQFIPSLQLETIETTHLWGIFDYLIVSWEITMLPSSKRFPSVLIDIYIYQNIQPSGIYTCDTATPNADYKYVAK